MKRTILFLILILTVSHLIFAQENNTAGLSLQECVKMAVEKNINVRIAQLDNEKSISRTDESRAALLPKISLAGSFQDNLAIASTMIPGEFVGKPGTEIPMQLGSQYNTSASVNISQVLYDRTAFLALEITKKTAALSDLSIEKAREETAADVARLYFLSLTTKEQQKLIGQNIARAEKLRDITKVSVQNGVGMQVDFDRVSVTLENYYTQLSNTQAIQEKQLNMMKYLLDIPQEQSITLTDSTNMLLLQTAPELTTDFSNHIDIKLIESQQEINVLNEKKIKSEYLPTLNLSGLFAYQGMKSEFNDYFSSNNKWYPYAYVSVGLRVSLFDGFAKRSKSHQANLEYRKTQEKMDATKENFSMNYKNAINNYLNNKNNLSRQQQNLKLGEKVFEDTSLKYREGLANMSNLVQDEISLRNAQVGYLVALNNFKDAEVMIISLDGHIMNLINK